MALDPVQIKDTPLKSFSPDIAIPSQESAGGIGSSGHITGQDIIQGVLDNPLLPITITSNSQTFDFSTNLFLIKNTAIGTYTMPLASGNAGKRLTIKKISDNSLPITIETQVGENFFDIALTNSINYMTVGSTIEFEADQDLTWHVI
jgi:hypothetical protein